MMAFLMLDSNLKPINFIHGSIDRRSLSWVVNTINFFTYVVSRVLKSLASTLGEVVGNLKIAFCRSLREIDSKKLITLFVRLTTIWCFRRLWSIPFPFCYFLLLVNFSLDSPLRFFGNTKKSFVCLIINSAPKSMIARHRTLINF